MNFDTMLLLAFAGSSVVSGMDKWIWSKQRVAQAEAVKAKRRNTDFLELEKIRQQPGWIELSDSIWVLSLIVAVVYIVYQCFSSSFVATASQ